MFLIYSRKNDTTCICVFADELEDMLPEYKGNIVLGDSDAVGIVGNVCPQNIGVQLIFSNKNSLF